MGPHFSTYLPFRGSSREHRAGHRRPLQRSLFSMIRPPGALNAQGLEGAGSMEPKFTRTEAGGSIRSTPVMRNVRPGIHRPIR